MYWAVGVMLLLFLLWGFFAVRSVGKTAANLTNQQNTPQISAQTASAAGVIGAENNRASEPRVASSTNGRVELVPASEIRP